MMGPLESAPGGAAHWAGGIRSRFSARRTVEALAWMPRASD
jgi:hypothetical protein